MEKGKRKLLLNFAGLDFIDSSGIGELVSSYVSVKNAGGKLRIASVPDKIMLILEYTSLGNIIEVFDDEASALEDFS
jgi:anti-sigma B factor antagonist